MSRDVLLACLAVALLVNLAFLGQVAILHSRRGREARRRRTAHRRLSPRRVIARPSTAPGSDLEFFVPTGPEARWGRLGPSSAPPQAAVSAASAVTAAVAPPPPSAPDVETPPLVEDQPEGIAPQASPEAEAVTSPRRTARHTPRGRRFVLPPLDEDHARSARAIEAFLGGSPPTGTAAERPHRRRHRARRPSGAPVPRTTMLVWLQGFGDLDRLIGTTRSGPVFAAFLEALRRSARATDEVREVGVGRVRVVVEADDAGANAYVERARAGVQPWLALLAVPLRVESGAGESTEVIPFGGTRRAVGDH